MKRTVKINRTKFVTGAMIIITFGLLFSAKVSAGTPYTDDKDQYYIPNKQRYTADDIGLIEKEISDRHLEGITNGTVKITMVEWRFFPYGAEKIWFGRPQVGGCSMCKSLDDGSIISSRIFLEDDSGREYISRGGYVLTKADLASTGLDFENLPGKIRAGLEVVQIPGQICPSCGKHVGDVVTSDGLFWNMRNIDVARQPSSVNATPGGSAVFEIVLNKYTDVLNGPVSYYKWQKNVNGTWENITDGTGASGEVYSGSDTSQLRVANISESMYGIKYRCELMSFLRMVYTDEASLILPEPTQPPQPTQPPTTPTPVPTSPTPTPIVPSGGGKTEYSPASSSSSYVLPGSSTSTGQSKPSSSTSTQSGGKGNESHTGGGVTVSAGGDTKIIATDPGGLNGNTSAMSKTGGTSRPSGTSSKGVASSSSGRGSSSNSVTRRNGENYVMKNGILYVIDDDTLPVGTEEGGKEERLETAENENLYQASDLAMDGQVQDMEYERGFFKTPAGYATIAAAAFLLLLLLVFLLFFGVIVFGEAEEHDEVFEFCALRLMRRREGNWYVSLGNAFDDNAVIKLRIGLIFAVIFEGWDIVGEVSGTYEGQIKGQVEQGMMLYRKSVRRIV